MNDINERTISNWLRIEAGDAKMAFVEMVEWPRRAF